MRKTILWSGIEYYSLEHCSVESNTDLIVVQSSIIGYYQHKIYYVSYQLKLDPQWMLIDADINWTHNGHDHNLQLQPDGTGNWVMNGQQSKKFAGCVDIDIPLTPFTNTLPIRRLNMHQGESRQIAVVYCDLLANDIRRVSQQYKCISTMKYHYANVPNDFEATIQVDDDGMVTEYPMLFKRTAAEIC